MIYRLAFTFFANLASVSAVIAAGWAYGHGDSHGDNMGWWFFLVFAWACYSTFSFSAPRPRPVVAAEFCPWCQRPGAPAPQEPGSKPV